MGWQEYNIIRYGFKGYDMKKKAFLVLLAIFCGQNAAFAGEDLTKKVWYGLRDAVRDKVQPGTQTTQPIQGVAPINGTQSAPLQQGMTTTSNQPIATSKAGAVKQKVQQEIEVYVDKKLGTNLSNKINVPVNNYNPNLNQGVNQNMPYATGQPAVTGNANSTLQKLGVDVQDIKVPEKYKQDYYKYRNQLKNLVK